MHDRMTKLLLSLIAVALWALLLRPAATPTPAHAQAPPRLDTSPMARFAAPVVNVPEQSNFIYVLDNAGWLYRVERTNMAITHSVRLMPKQ